MNQELLRSFQDRFQYKQASRASKPVQDFPRFVKNQIRQVWKQPAGTIEKTSIFHVDDFTIVAGETVSEGLACYGIMEPELTEAFLHLVKPGQTVVDIGMHLGYFTTLFAILVGSEGQVHSFEPTPSTREIADQNTSRFSNIHVYPNAVWSHRATMTFHDYGLARMAFNSVTSARLDHKVTTVLEHQVDTVSLDDFRIKLGCQIDVIKIDAETAEEQILNGAREVLSTDRPIVTLEVGDEGADTGRSRTLIEMLATMGYDAWEFSEGGFRRHLPRATYEYDNLIFSPSDRLLS